MPLSDDDLAQVAEHLTPVFTKLVTDTTSKVTNDALTKRFTSFEAKLGETLKTTIAGLATDIDTRLDEKVASIKPPTKGDPPLPPAPDPVIKGLQKQIETLTSQSQALTAERAAERTNARKATAAQKAQEAYIAGGGDPSRARQALGYLRAEERFGYEADDSDTLVFTDESGEKVDLATGMSTWLKSADGMHYVPPRGAGGSGAAGAKNLPRKAAGITKGDLTEALGNMALGGMINIGPRPGQ